MTIILLLIYLGTYLKPSGVLCLQEVRQTGIAQGDGQGRRLGATKQTSRWLRDTNAHTQQEAVTEDGPETLSGLNNEEQDKRQRRESSPAKPIHNSRKIKIESG